MLSALLYAAECWEPSVTQPWLRDAQAAALAATVWTCDQSSTHQMRPLKRGVRGAEAGTWEEVAIAAMSGVGASLVLAQRLAPSAAPSFLPPPQALPEAFLAT